jgi:hypothetical protein
VQEIKIGLWYHREMSHMFADIKSTRHIIQFLLDTEVGNRADKKQKEQRDEERDEVNRWENLMENLPEQGANPSTVVVSFPASGQRQQVKVRCRSHW